MPFRDGTGPCKGRGMGRGRRQCAAPHNSSTPENRQCEGAGQGRRLRRRWAGGMGQEPVRPAKGGDGQSNQ